MGRGRGNRRWGEGRGGGCRMGLVVVFFLVCSPMRGERVGNQIVDIPEDSSYSSSAGSPGQSSSSSISAHSGRSAWPWHRAGLTHGWGLVATRTSCFSETVVLNEKGISLYRLRLMQSIRLLVCHDVGHQLGIRRHLSGRYSDRMLSNKLVVLGRPKDAHSHISAVQVEAGRGEARLIKRSAP